MTFPEARLRTGLPAVEAKAFAKEASSHTEWVEELIRISSDPDGGTVPRKAAWVLRHAALHNPACVADRGVALLDAVDDSQDTSTGNCSKRCWKRQERSSDVWAQNCLTSGWAFAQMPAFPWPWSMWACCCCTPRASHLAQR